MQLKKSLLIHGAGCAIIATLLSLIFQERRSDRDTPLQTEAHASFSAVHTLLNYRNQELLNKIAIVAEQYTAPQRLSIANRAKRLEATLDSLEMQLDSLQNRPQDDELLYRVQRQLQMYRSAVAEALTDSPQKSDTIPVFAPANWLFQSYKNDSHARFRTVIAETKLKAIFMECVLFNYCAMEIFGCGGHKFFQTHMRIQQLSPSVGDTVVAEVSLCDYEHGYPTTFTLNGQSYHMSQGAVSFDLRFDQPGIYPLRAAAHVLNVLTDSTTISESTYWLRVRE